MSSDTLDRNKAIIRRFIDEVMNAGRLEVIDELYAPKLAGEAKRWIAPFQSSFPDTHMEIVDLIAEGDTVVGRFRCSGTHLGDWMGHPPTGRRFTRIDEVGFFRIENGKITRAWSLEDTLRQLEQLELR
jgi:predicted ester cyclase